MFQTTSAEPAAGSPRPRGNVKMIPTPMEAAIDARRKKLVGTVGAVPKATAACVSPTGSPTSSAKNATPPVNVGVLAERPIPITAAVAAPLTQLSSMIAAAFVDGDSAAHDAAAIVVTVVRRERE